MGGKRMRAGGFGGGGEEAEMEDNEPSYEAERKAILEENRQRMLELGLLDASNLFPAPSPKTPRKLTPKLTPSGPPRRSSRVSVAPTLYQPPLPQVTRRVLPRAAPQVRAEYSGPVRRSSRLQGTTRVSYKAQLQGDKDDPEEMFDTTKDKGGSTSSQESEVIEF